MAPQLILGGITVPRYAGAGDVNYAPAGGFADVVLSQGRPVRMRHWSKELITLRGVGWMATGLAVLDWDAEHELLCPRPKRMATTGAQVTLSSDPRPDVPVTAHALVGREWVTAGVTVNERLVSVVPVAGAAQYSVAWYPRFTVLCTPPAEDYAGGDAAWQIACREV